LLNEQRLRDEESQKWKAEIERLEQERRRIEKEREEVQEEKETQSCQWQARIEQMREEQRQVLSNLEQANWQYKAKAQENEDLKEKLTRMTTEHQYLVEKFQEFEKRLPLKDASPEKPKKQVVNQDSLKMIEGIFTVDSGSHEQHLCIKKIQELLMYSENKGEESIKEGIVAPLLFYYARLRHTDQRLGMVKQVRNALESEDVLLALSPDVFHGVMEFLLKSFAKEKAILES